MASAPASADSRPKKASESASAVGATTVAATITVRKATVEDYQAVLDINRNVYMGLDYIPHYYQQLVTDPDFSFYLCEVDGEVGAFEGVCLLDDNASLMTRAARVKDKFQGQGLLLHIRKRIYEDFKDVPGEKNIRNCCTNMVRLVHSKKFLDQNRTLGIKTLVALPPLNVDLAIPPPYDTCIPEVSEQTLEEFGNMFDDPALCRYLFPEGFVSVISWFFKLTKTNLRHIRKQNVFISVSNSIKARLVHAGTASGATELGTGDDRAISPSLRKKSTKHESSTKRDPGHSNIEGLLAISGHYTSPGSFLYMIDIYGEPRQGKEEEDYRQLLFHSMEKAGSLCKGLEQRLPLSLCLSLRNDMYIEVIRKILFSLGFEEGEMTELFTKHYYFEQSFEQLLN